jgi:RNA polymerase sigma factor (sigma-70 family)
MNGAHTTAVVQRYLDELAHAPGDGSPAPAVRDVLAGAASRLQLLCASLLHRSYPRLTRPPVNLRTDEMLGAVVERLIKAMREARPTSVRQFFALANQHMRWELNDLARRLDETSAVVELPAEPMALPESSHSGLSPSTRRILAAIEALPDEEREVFDLVRMQGLAHTEVAEILGISTKTVQRRLNRGLLSLTDVLGDLRAAPGSAGAGDDGVDAPAQ